MPFAATSAAVGIGTAAAGAAASAGISAALGGGGGGGGAAAAADPFSSQRMPYQTLLQDLVYGNDPSKFLESTPGYQWNLNQGLQAVQGSAAANGMLNSGNVLTALQKQGSGIASQEYWNQFNALAQLSGANIGSPGTAGQIMANQGAANQQSASALGNQVGGLVQQGLGGLFGGGGGSGYSSSSLLYGSGYQPGSTGYSGGGNTYGFTTDGGSAPAFTFSG